MNATQYGLVWIASQQRYFKEFKPMRQNRGQERVKIKLGSKWYPVEINQVKRWPAGESIPRSQTTLF